jgi:hypothetical protein
VDPIPDLVLGKSGSVGNRSQDLWICSQKLTTRPQRWSRHIQEMEINEYIIFLGRHGDNSLERPRYRWK